MKNKLLLTIMLGMFLISFTSAFDLEKHLIQVEVDENYPCYIENEDTIVCPAIDNSKINEWKDKISNLKVEEKDLGLLKDNEKISALNEKKTLYQGKTLKEIDLTKEYREKVDINKLDSEIKIGFNTNVFAVSGTPLENFDVNTTTGMVRYRPLNMTWVYLSGYGKSFTLPDIDWDSNVSYSFWLKSSGVIDSNKTIIRAGTKNIIEYQTNGNIKTCFNNATNSAECFYVAYPLNDSLWHHIALSLNVNTKNLSLYIDSANIGSLIITGFNFGSSSSFHSFGSTSGSTLNTTIDEFRFRDVINPFSEEEINQIYSSGRISNSSLPSADIWYSFNEKVGTILYNKGTSGYNSTLVGTWQSDNINVTTLGYPVNISIVNITNAYIYWDNGTVWNNTNNIRFNGATTFSFLNNQTIWILESFSNNSLVGRYKLNENNGTIAYNSYGEMDNGTFSGTWQNDGILETLTNGVDYTIDTATGLITLSSNYLYYEIQTSWSYLSGESYISGISTSASSTINYLPLIFLVIIIGIISGIIIYIIIPYINLSSIFDKGF